MRHLEIKYALHGKRKATPVSAPLSICEIVKAARGSSEEYQKLADKVVYNQSQFAFTVVSCTCGKNCSLTQKEWQALGVKFEAQILNKYREPVKFDGKIAFPVIEGKIIPSITLSDLISAQPMSATPENQNQVTFECIHCRTKFTHEDLEKDATGGCPNCKTKVRPISSVNEETISINAQELRILCIFAERHAMSCDDANLDTPNYENLKDTVYAISRKIKKQMKSVGCLTLKEEVDEMSVIYPNAKLIINGHEQF